jgi:hypothetical protein
MCSYSVSTDERRLLKEVPTSVHSMRASALLGPFVMKRARGRPKRLTRSAERYRRYARQCVEMAPTFQDKKARRMLLRFAQGWSRLRNPTGTSCLTNLASLEVIEKATVGKAC